MRLVLRRRRAGGVLSVISPKWGAGVRATSQRWSVSFHVAAFFLCGWYLELWVLRRRPHGFGFYVFPSILVIELLLLMFKAHIISLKMPVTPSSEWFLCPFDRVLLDLDVLLCQVQFGFFSENLLFLKDVLVPLVEIKLRVLIVLMIIFLLSFSILSLPHWSFLPCWFGIWGTCEYNTYRTLLLLIIPKFVIF